MRPDTNEGPRGPRTLTSLSENRIRISGITRARGIFSPNLKEVFGEFPLWIYVSEVDEWD